MNRHHIETIGRKSIQTYTYGPILAGISFIYKNLRGNFSGCNHRLGSRRRPAEFGWIYGHVWLDVVQDIGGLSAGPSQLPLKRQLHAVYGAIVGKIDLDRHRPNDGLAIAHRPREQA